MPEKVTTHDEILQGIQKLTETLESDESLVELGKDGIVKTFSDVREIVEAASNLRITHDKQVRRLQKLFGASELKPMRTRKTKDQSDSALKNLDW